MSCVIISCQFRWTNTNVKLLGIHHGYEIDNVASWLEKISKIIKNLFRSGKAEI